MRSRLHLLFAALAFLSVGAMVCLVHFRKASTLPEESPEVAARRLDQNNNGWFLLSKIRPAVVPPIPVWVPVAPGSGSVQKYDPLPNSLGMLLDLEVPDDSPELIEYIRCADALIPKVREAVAKPWIMLPIDWHDKKSNFYAPYMAWRGRQIPALVWVMVARAELLTREQPGSPEALQIIKEALQLASIARECSLEDRLNSTHWFFACKILKAAPGQVQQQMLAWALDQLSRPRPSDEAIFTYLRLQQASLNDARLDREIALNPYDPLHLPRARRDIVKHQDVAYLAMRGRWDDLEQLPENKRRAVDSLGWRALGEETFQWNRGLTRLTVVLARELYRADNGSYPPDVQALVPQYLPAVPQKDLLPTENEL